MSAKIFPVILSGGSGSRLWPLSRESFPKQLLPLAGERTMLQDTAQRVADPARFHPVTVIANAEHRFVIAEQLREIGQRQPTIVLEPVARNTAPAVAAAALIASQQDPDALILVMPADHAVPDAAGFLAAIDAGVPAAEGGALVLFGIQPDSPATGYGYIRAGATLTGAAHKVDAFVEKPDLATAEGYLADGRYSWNSGIFLLPAKSVIAELETHEPAVLAAVRAALDAAQRDMDFLRLDPDAFAKSPSISIDYAVMERTAKAAVVPSTFAWSDVGAWSALWKLAGKDLADNVEIGDVLTVDTRGSYLRTEGPLIAAVGVEDLIIVATPDAVLVANRHKDQDVKTVVERLRAANHASAVQTRRVYRPWGSYEGVSEGERFQVKRITVNPGHKLSLQKHFHRAEHWVVVNGTAEVHLDGETRLLAENESIYIPLGSTHRLGNPGKVPLNLIEVQSGAYLGEDDIVRFEDAYARA
ncbi:mannose-1-phosphate guanylyltransferase/mannose-6-phosphate isomerase [Phenylobacterium sp. LjRoot219]|uniref:mannose-1-phosphate guanylyltransferase/mannose-6-phosphate isomerase n=1 Tax=Phenylobacterium sp. LjRoot219 TaxID=3342283 RepID=UPI003ECD3B03